MSEKVITDALFTYLWMAAGAIPARIAWNRGRGIIAWWVIGAFTWPILLFVAAVVPENKEVLAARAASPDPEREWRDTLRGGLALLALMAVSFVIRRAEGQ